MAGEVSTVLGKSITVRGEIVGSEDLVIDGKVEGSIKLTESRLTIGPNAEIFADLHVHDAILLGRCEGNVIASGRVELRKGASLTGNLTVARLSVEDTAYLKGNVLLSGTKEA
ncbi:bactofilin family protein [Terriglobus roseus]|nr:polymer-forming cytoskeletal protein [Terriglobus roseus]